MNLAHASIRFRAEHCSGEEGWHTHTWRVFAFWHDGAWRDGRRPQEVLMQAIDRLTVMVEGRRRFDLPTWSNEQIVRLLEAEKKAERLPKYIVKLAVIRAGYGVERWV